MVRCSSLGSGTHYCTVTRTIFTTTWRRDCDNSFKLSKRSTEKDAYAYTVNHSCFKICITIAQKTYKLVLILFIISYI